MSRLSPTNQFTKERSGVDIILLLGFLVGMFIPCRLMNSDGNVHCKCNLHVSSYCRNRQPPPSGLGTASPAYVEARMYAPANAPRRQVTTLSL